MLIFIAFHWLEAGAGKMTLCVTDLPFKSDGLSSIIGIHVKMEGEN